MSVLRDQAVLLGSLAHFFLLRELLVLITRRSFEWVPSYFLVPARPMVEALGRVGIAFEFGLGSWMSVSRFPIEFFGGQNPRKDSPALPTHGWSICLPPAACRLPPPMATKKLPTPARAKVTRHRQDRLALMPSTCYQLLTKSQNNLKNRLH